jgi:hypothetical protein
MTLVSLDQLGIFALRPAARQWLAKVLPKGE